MSMEPHTTQVEPKEYQVPSLVSPQQVVLSLVQVVVQGTPMLGISGMSQGIQSSEAIPQKTSSLVELQPTLQLLTLLSLLFSMLLVVPQQPLYQQVPVEELTSTPQELLPPPPTKPSPLVVIPQAISSLLH